MANACSHALRQLPAVAEVFGRRSRTVYGQGTLIVAAYLGLDDTRCRGLVAVIFAAGVLLRCVSGLDCGTCADACV